MHESKAQLLWTRLGFDGLDQSLNHRLIEAVSNIEISFYVCFIIIFYQNHQSTSANYYIHASPNTFFLVLFSNSY